MSRCSAPACRCVSPCDAHYSNQDHYEEDACPGWRDCAGCESCEDYSVRQVIHRARVARPDTLGRPILPGMVVGVVERVHYRVGGPVVRRERLTYAFDSRAEARWVEAGSPRRPSNYALHCWLRGEACPLP